MCSLSQNIPHFVTTIHETKCPLVRSVAQFSLVALGKGSIRAIKKGQLYVNSDLCEGVDAN